jgi:hypothetical protein
VCVCVCVTLYTTQPAGVKTPSVRF